MVPAFAMMSKKCKGLWLFLGCILRALVVSYQQFIAIAGFLFTIEIRLSVEFIA